MKGANDKLFGNIVQRLYIIVAAVRQTAVDFTRSQGVISVNVVERVEF